MTWQIQRTYVTRHCTQMHTPTHGEYTSRFLLKRRLDTSPSWVYRLLGSNTSKYSLENMQEIVSPGLLQARQPDTWGLHYFEASFINTNSSLMTRYGMTIPSHGGYKSICPMSRLTDTKLFWIDSESYRYIHYHKWSALIHSEKTFQVRNKTDSWTHGLNESS